MSDSIHCRLCAELKSYLDLVNISEEDASFVSLKQKILFCFQLEINPNDVLPKTVCTKCCENVSATYDFTKKMEQAQEILCEIYTNNENIKLELTEVQLKDVNEIKPVSEETFESRFDNEPADKQEYWSDANGVDNDDDDSDDDDEPLSTIKKSGTRKITKEIDNGEKIVKKRDRKEWLWKDYEFSCTLCEMKCSSIKELREHYKDLHVKSAEFKCTDCSEIYSKYLMFKRHVLKHRNRYKYWCEICNKFFHLKFRYDSHMKHVHAPKDTQKYVCPTCGKSFKWPSSLENHRRYVHLPDEQKYAFECDICHKRVTSASNLTIHKKVHEDTREHTCEHCGVAFKQQGNLKQHIIHKHMDLKDLQLVQCPHCPKIFKSAYSMKRHERVHYVGEMFKCGECKREFRHKRALHRHEKIHTGELPFECEYCNKRFRGKSDLHIHLRQHTGERPYSCIECNHFFSNNSNFIKHLKGRHGLKNFSIANQRQYPFINEVLPL